ncbi:MAG: hypothetical protein ACREQP_20960 [Candidatus Binatia bacterium]
MAYFKDVREHLAALEAAGLLVRVDATAREGISAPKDDSKS